MYKLILTILLLFSLGTNSLFAQDEFADFESELNEAFGDDEFSDQSKEKSNEGSFGEEQTLLLTGMIEIEQGGHMGKTGVHQREWIMSSTRGRIAASKNLDVGSFFLKLDFIDDRVLKRQEFDLREGRIRISPWSWVDLSVGKQVVTWGVADMLYINDLFPKNWVANFLGRDMEDMKDSAFSYRMTSYFGSGGLDLVYHPDFAPDTTPTGCRFAIYNPNSMMDNTQESLVSNREACDSTRENSLQTGEYSEGEFASRLYHRFGSHEVGLYTYSGFYKNPRGLQWADSAGKPTGNKMATPESGDAMLIADYPRLNVYGFSAEGQLGPGIYSMEFGFYDSREDREGENPLIENSSNKFLAGYRLALSQHLSLGAQIFQEQMNQYEAYEFGLLQMVTNQLIAQGTSSASAEQLAEKEDLYQFRKEEIHNTFTLRATFKAQQDTIWINFFIYERPQDHDRMIKLDLTKRFDDQVEVVIGANIFEGDENYLDREFAMHKDDDNAFLRLRYSY